MSLQFKSLVSRAVPRVAAQAAQAAQAGMASVRPSDCRPRDADSTCATAVAGAPWRRRRPAHPDATLYDGPLGGVPAGYAYWGFDFVADETELPSPVRPDEFINRSNVPVTITFSFTSRPTTPATATACPACNSRSTPAGSRSTPPCVFNGDTVSYTQTFEPGRGYGWVIGLWQSTNPRLTVSVPGAAKRPWRRSAWRRFPRSPTKSLRYRASATAGMAPRWRARTAAAFRTASSAPGLRTSPTTSGRAPSTAARQSAERELSSAVVKDQVRSMISRAPDETTRRWSPRKQPGRSYSGANDQRERAA